METLNTQNDDDSRENLFCVNCTQPLSLQSQLMDDTEEKYCQNYNNNQIVREISIDLSIFTDDDYSDASTQNKPSIKVNVQTVLSSIYKLDYLNDLSHIGERFKLNLDDDEEFVVCSRCSAELKTLYTSYHKFNQYRQSSSLLASKINQLDTIINSILNSEPDVQQNNDDDNEWDVSMPIEVCVDDQDEDIGHQNENIFSTSTQTKDNKTKISPSGPWVKLTRLTQEEISSVCTPRENKVRVTRSQINFHYSDDDDDPQKNSDDPDFDPLAEESYLNERNDRINYTSQLNSELTPTSCTVCEESFDSTDVLFDHLMTQHVQNKDWKCPICDQMLCSKDTIGTHLRQIHLTYKPFICPVPTCKKEFASSAYMKKHLKRGHKRPRKSTSTTKPRGQGSQTTNKFSTVPPTSSFGPPDPGPPSSCSICSLSCDTCAALVTHLMTDHRSKSDGENSVEGPTRICPICSKAVTSEETLLIHVRNHIGYKPYTCPRCQGKFASKAYLKHHLQNSEKSEPSRNRCIALPCAFCNEYFRSQNTLDQHYKSSHINQYPFLCETCQKGCYFQSQLTKHQETHLEKPYTCPKCDFQKFSIESDLLHHLETCQGPKSHSCPTCHRNFATREYMLKHAKIHSGETFQCDQCGQSFLTLRALKGHMRRHVNSSFPCEQCLKVFTTQGNLNVHLSTVHSTVKSFLCQLCGKAYGHRRGLKLHMMSHSDSKPFTCHCGKSYKTNDSLKYHQQTHSEVRSHICPVCNFAFYHARGLRKHLKTHKGYHDSI